MYSYILSKNAANNTANAGVLLRVASGGGDGIHRRGEKERYEIKR
jgi:hypothetical protein